MNRANALMNLSPATSDWRGTAPGFEPRTSTRAQRACRPGDTGRPERLARARSCGSGSAAASWRCCRRYAAVQVLAYALRSAIQSVPACCSLSRTRGGRTARPRSPPKRVGVRSGYDATIVGSSPGSACSSIASTCRSLAWYALTWARRSGIESTPPGIASQPSGGKRLRRRSVPPRHAGSKQPRSRARIQSAGCPAKGCR